MKKSHQNKLPYKISFGVNGDDEVTEKIKLLIGKWMMKTDNPRLVFYVSKSMITNRIHADKKELFVVSTGKHRKYDFYCIDGI